MNTKNISTRAPKGTARKTTTQQTSTEPANKQGAAWRRWKANEMRRAFAEEGDTAAKREAWEDFKDLLLVIDHPSFYHVENALLLLPALLSIKQTLDAQDAQTPDE